MNKKPNVSGINRYWKRGEDDRISLALRMNRNPESRKDQTFIDEFLEALQVTVMKRRRTKIIGFGVFEWIKWKNRIPTGERVDTWRLTFKPSRYVKGKYNGDR